MNTTIFTEAIDLSEAILDTPNRILKDVVLIRAGNSENDNTYTPELLQGAAPIFENAKAFLNHQTREQIRLGQGRGAENFTGVFRNIRFAKNALYADRVFTRTQAGQTAMSLAEDVVSGLLPKNSVGLSINAVGRGRKENGKTIVESIVSVNSVDDVVNPAAGGSYTEGVIGEQLTTALLEAMEYDEWVSARSDFTERLKDENRKVRWNDAVRTAKADAEKYKELYEQAQVQITQMQAESAQVETLKRELAIEKLVGKINLPDDWDKDLRESLTKADMKDWSGIIEREKQKAKSAGHRAAMTGAGQQVNTPLPATIKPANPVEAIRQRLAEAKSPEELQSLMRQLGLQE